jgi:hypothetical protein
MVTETLSIKAFQKNEKLSYPPRYPACGTTACALIFELVLFASSYRATHSVPKNRLMQVQPRR